MTVPFPIPKINESINWSAMCDSPFLPLFNRMKQTPQNPQWHAEGDVWTHTQMVCQALVEMDNWQQESTAIREILFTAALLHDIGKPACTREENGVLVSPKHNQIGAKLAREILWRDCNMAGREDLRQTRETICSLIRFHSTPPNILNSPDPVYSVLRPASESDLIPGFNNRLLAILAEADMRGRTAENKPESVDKVRLFAAQAEETGCLNGPFTFPSDYTRFLFFQRLHNDPTTERYDDTWGEVVLLSGLPGTGKDTYIAKNFAGWPIVSLDQIRADMKAEKANDQGPVLQAARETARRYLREQRPFVWNATNISAFVRKPLIQLFTDYKAAARIVFLETNWNVEILRNHSRERAVPQATIDSMFQRMEPPTVREAVRVEWFCV